MGFAGGHRSRWERMGGKARWEPPEIYTTVKIGVLLNHVFNAFCAFTPGPNSFDRHD